MDKMRQLLLVAMGIKIVVILFALSVAGVSYVVAKVWFDVNVSTAAIAQVLERDPDVNARNDYGLTGLMFAAGNSEYDRVQLLLSHGAQVNLQSGEEGDTALHIACYNGNFPDEVKIIELLIANGADVTIANKDGQHAIHYALQIDNLATRLCVFRLLVLAGENINAQNNEGNTVLLLSVEMMQKDWIAQLVQEFGSSIDLSIKNKAGETALDRARLLGFTGTDSIEELLMSLEQK